MMVELSVWLGDHDSQALIVIGDPGSAAAAEAENGLSIAASQGWQISINCSAGLNLRRLDLGEEANVATVGGASGGGELLVVRPGLWNLLRLTFRRRSAPKQPILLSQRRQEQLESQVKMAGGEEETVEVYWNPSAQPTAPALRYRILPSFNVTAPVVALSSSVVKEGGPGRMVSLIPPHSSHGFVMYDYVSVLPADGGIG